MKLRSTWLRLLALLLLQLLLQAEVVRKVIYWRESLSSTSHCLYRKLRVGTRVQHAEYEGVDE